MFTSQHKTDSAVKVAAPEMIIIINFTGFANATKHPLINANAQP